MSTQPYQPETLAVHAGTVRSQFNEHSEALFLTSSYVFDSAAQAAARFIGEEPGNIYSRFTNPTVTMFEERLAALEGAEQCVATASGMSAILACGMGLLKSGDHIVASRSIFGATVNLFGAIFKRFGVETTFVSATDVSVWTAAVRPNTRLFFLETPSNPLTEVSDIAAIAAVAKKHGALLAVDNCFCTPILQRPFDLGADIVIHSATKYIDGQGRVLGGAVLGSKKVMEPVYQFLRTAGHILVFEHGKHRESFRFRLHINQVLRQRARRVGIVRHIQNQHGLPWYDLKASRQQHLDQAAPHCCHTHRQFILERIQRRQRRTRVMQLVRAAQSRIRQGTARTRHAAIIPLLRTSSEAELFFC